MSKISALIKISDKTISANLFAKAKDAVRSAFSGPGYAMATV